MSCTISNQPVEIITRFFGYLPPRGLKSAVLVCRLWKDIGEDPKLWTWTLVTVNSMCDFDKLDIHRLKLVQNLKVLPSFNPDCNLKHPSDLMEFFKAVEAISTIKRIDGIKTHNLQSVETSLLISVLSRLSELKLTYDGNLSQEEQLHLIFTAIIEKKAQVEKLTIAGNTIYKLSSSLFASAASNVVKLKLFN